MIHASLVIFDAHGKRIQDYGLKLEDKKLNGLEQTSDFIFHEERVALAFKKEKEIKITSNKLDGAAIADTIAIQLKNPTEIVRNDSESNSFIRFWYRNSFYVWGYQNVKDTSRHIEDPTRYVFYINKVEIR